MTRRPAVTLIEALMAIFVMAIGLLALLTLFPLGAVQMALSLKDDRTAQAASIAVTQWKSFDLSNDPIIGQPAATPLFENPWPGGLFPLNNGFEPSYPVYVDPIGLAAMGGGPPATLTNIGGVPNGVPRTTVSRVPTAQYPGVWPQRWFTLQDDLTFADNGIPDPGSLANGGNSPIQREGRYSWAYLVRRQAAAVPAPAVNPGTPPIPPIDLTIVVYAARSPGADFAGNPLGETAYAQTTFVSGNLVSVNYGATGQARPAVRRGSWVFDARMLTIPPPTRPNLALGNAPQGYFYRVVSVNDVSNGVVELEVQRPLGGSVRVFGNIPGTNPPQPYPPGPLVVMENVSEVFEKGVAYLQND